MNEAGAEQHDVPWHWWNPMTWNPLRRRGRGKIWAEDAKSNIRYLRARLDVIRAREGLLDYAKCDPDAALCSHVQAQSRRREIAATCVNVSKLLDGAQKAAMGEEPRYLPIVSPWTGACIEATYKNIHYAEAAIVRLYDPEEVAFAAPDALRRAKSALADDDPTRRDALRLLHEAEDPHKTCSCSAKRLGEIVTVGHEAADRSRARLHTFRNVVITGAVVTTLLLALFIYFSWKNPTFVSLCFHNDLPPEKPGYTIVCPTRQSLKGATEVGPTSPDLFTIAMLGLLGGALSAAFFIRGLYVNATPYNVAIPLAILKIPAGAMVAVSGMILLAGDFVPGFSAIDKQSQILAYALVFGFAQQLFTQTLDHRAEKLIASVPSKGRRQDLPMAGPSRDDSY